MHKLDLHGANRYEAKVLVESFLYESYCTKQYFVCIVHGHGDYIIKNEVWDALSASPYVERYEFAPPQFGGAGATIVYIDQGAGRDQS